MESGKSGKETRRVVSIVESELPQQNKNIFPLATHIIDDVSIAWQ